VTIERASCKLATPHPIKNIEVTMSAAFHFLEVLVVSVAALVALTLLLLVIVAHLPGSPLKEILAALARRIGATAAVSLLAAPLEAIPGVDVLYDAAGIVFLAIYWLGIFKAIAAALKSRAVAQ
jgi:hypothetical protein